MCKNSRYFFRFQARNAVYWFFQIIPSFLIPFRKWGDMGLTKTDFVRDFLVAFCL